MDSWKVATIFLVTLFCCVQYGSSIKCYTCNSFKDPKCNDPFEPNRLELTDCAQLDPGQQNYTYCRKTFQKATLGEKYDERIIRSCGFEKERRFDDDEEGEGKYKCYIRTGTFNIEVRYCACEEDGCNGVGKVGVYHSLLAIMGIAAVLKLCTF